MEAVGIIILIAVGWFLFRLALGASTRTVRAAGRAAIGKGSFNENMAAAFKGAGPLQARLTDHRIGDNEDGVPFKQIEIKGEIPVTRTSHIAICVSIFDRTDEDAAPVISILDDQQEPDSIVFQSLQELPTASPGHAFISWVNAAAFVPDFLQPPYSGERKLLAVVRLIDLDNPPSISAGYASGEEGILWTECLTFAHYYPDKGYREAADTGRRHRRFPWKSPLPSRWQTGALTTARGR